MSARFELDDRQPAYRVFAVAFALLAAFLAAVTATAQAAAWPGRAPMGAAAAAAALFSAAFARSPWRLHTALDGATVTHTAQRLVGRVVTRFETREVEAVELVAKGAPRAVIVLRDGRRVEAMRPWDRRGPDARPRAEALAKALGAPLRSK